MFLDNSIVLDKFPIISIYKVLIGKNRDTDIYWFPFECQSPSMDYWVMLAIQYILSNLHFETEIFP